MRRMLALVSAAVVAVGVVSAPVAAAQGTNSPRATTTASFGATCLLQAPSVAGIGGPMDVSPSDPIDIHVTAPESVEVGETFDVTFGIDPISVDLDSLPSAISLQEASRLKLDLQRPAGTTLVGAQFSGGSLNNTATAQALTVNDAGQPDPDGSVIRLTDAGHHTIGNGGNVDTRSHRGIGLGLSGATSLDLAIPEITLTFVADRAAQSTIGVRHRGNAAAYGANPASFLTILASASVPLMGTQWVPAYCSPRASATSAIDARAAAMATVDIRGLETSVSLSPADTVYLRTPAEFVATVTAANPEGMAGTVTFVSGTQRVTAPVDPATGEARAELTFTTPPSGPVVATFTPDDPAYAIATAEYDVVPERLATPMTLTAPDSATAHTRTALTAEVPAEARGTIVFTGGGQERTVEVRDGRAATSMTFTEPGDTEVTAAFTPSATSPYAPSSATATITVGESTSTTLVLAGVDEPGYVAEPVTLEATVNPAEGTSDPQGRVEFVTRGQSQIVEVVDGSAVAEFTFGRAGDVPVTATYYPTGTGQTQASDSGTLSIYDSLPTTSRLLGPAVVAPGTPTPFTLEVSPAGAGGTADVRIDGRVVATDVEVVDGEGTVTLDFPPSVHGQRVVTVDFTPADPRLHRRHTVEHTVTVKVADVDEDALVMDISGGDAPVIPGERTPFRVAVAPLDPGLAPDALDGYLTLANNGEVVRDGDDDPVRIPVTRGVADLDVVWTSGYPASKYLEFVYHSPDGTERVSGAVQLVVADGTGDPGAPDTVRVLPAGGDPGELPDPDGPDDGAGRSGAGSLDLGSLARDTGSLAGLFGR